MTIKTFKNYHGQAIRINGVCYNYIGETTAQVNSSPLEIESTFSSCLQCAIETSSSLSSESLGNLSSSTSSGNFSESTSESSRGYTTSSSDSSESLGNFSTSSSSDSTQSKSSESFGNFSSSSESIGNESSSQSLGLNCIAVEIINISGNQLIFVPGPPLSNLPEGSVCINGLYSGILDTGGSSNTVEVSDSSIFSVGQFVEICEGGCCFRGIYTKRCLYQFIETTLTWELISSDNQRTNACSLDFKCVYASGLVYQIHQFDTLEERNQFVCPQNPIGVPPERCKSPVVSSSSSSEMHSESNSSSSNLVIDSSSSSSIGNSSLSSSSESGGGSPLAKVNCTANTNPRIKMTICWTNAPTNYSFLGQSWNNGESKILCPENYFFGSNYTNREQWYIINTNSKFALYGDGGVDNRVAIRKIGTAAQFRLDQHGGKDEVLGSYDQFNNVVAGVTIGSFGYFITPSFTSFFIHPITSAQFHFITITTTSYGTMTIKWDPIDGNNLGSETWADFQATNLVPASPSGNEPCP